MSMGLLVGFIVAYPMNWWLVANHLKHGMMTVRPAAAAVGGHDHGAHAGATGSSDAVSPMSMSGAAAPRPPVPVMALNALGTQGSTGRIVLRPAISLSLSDT
jgi:hypothetical protein